jgi:hypothetical protein
MCNRDTMTRADQKKCNIGKAYAAKREGNEE